MKRKIISISMALVLALSLSLVMAVPAGAAVSGITVDNDPTTVSRPAAYTIDFTTTQFLLGDVATITIDFPLDTTVPNGAFPDSSKVAVNGEECTNVTGVAADQEVTITVPNDIIAGDVTVVFDADAGLANPSTVADDWTLDVETSAEPAGTSSAYSTTAAVPPSLSVSGTTYQNANDTVVITFSEAVTPADLAWSDNEFDSIKRGDTPLTLTNASFDPDATDTVLTVTLNEAADGDYLATGQLVKVTPALNAIVNAWLDAVPNTEQQGSVTGDAVGPTVDLAYDLARPVKDADILNITATFSEAMAATPQIAIATPGGGDVAATGMTIGIDNTQWTYALDVPAGTDEDGTATVTITGADLAGNASGTPTNNTFTIDNTRPGVSAIVGTTIVGAGDTVIITFSETVTAEDGDLTDGDEFTSIEYDDTALTLTNATFALEDSQLTITLDEATDLDYLVNGNNVTVTLAGGADGILDAALNEMLSGAENSITSSAAVDGDVTPPTIINIVAEDADTIGVTLSEAVLPADGTWSPNEFFLIENPAGAPVNVTNATVTADNNPGLGMATVLTIDLNAPIDGATLDVAQTVSVTPDTGAINDLAGNLLAADKVSSGEATAPTITDVEGTTIQGAGDTVVLTFSEPVSAADGTWSVNEFTRIEAPNGTDLVPINATFSPSTGSTSTLTFTLDEATDGEYLVNGEAVSATPAANAIVDADGNAVANTEVAAADVVDGDVTLPTIDSIVGTVLLADTIRIDFSEAVVPADNTWTVDGEFTVTGADLAGATFAPVGGITTTLIITLATDLTPGDTLTVTPVVDEILDLAGNAMTIDPIDSAQPVNGSYAIDLVEGWNLISLPLIPNNTAIEAVLTGVTVESVWNYTAPYSPDSWSSYFPGFPPNLVTMVDGKAYWVNLTATGTIHLEGVEMSSGAVAPPTYDVVEGWNFIGFKSLTPREAQKYLLGIAGSYTMIYGFDADTQGYYAVPFDQNLEPGKGYWLAVKEAGTIYP